MQVIGRIVLNAAGSSRTIEWSIVLQEFPEYRLFGYEIKEGDRVVWSLIGHETLERVWEDAIAQLSKLKKF